MAAKQGHLALPYDSARQRYVYAAEQGAEEPYDRVLEGSERAAAATYLVLFTFRRSFSASSNANILSLFSDGGAATFGSG